MRSALLLAIAASLSSSNAVYQGFNYGSTAADGSFRAQSDFQALFSAAKSLVGTSGFTSARLYTMIQGGSSTNEPTSAIPAAIAEDTSLLLGLWASGGQGGMDAEITALKSAINKYGTAFTSLVAGISVGSEDLYRISPTGIAAKSGYGADPATIATYISQVRQAISGTALSGASIGHVDTWTAWVNATNQPAIDACDWIGMDAYPYFQSTMTNPIESGAQLFNDAYSATAAAVGGKPVWITETGWPVSGATSGQAIPSTENAKTYWDEVGCPSFGTVNTWWFTIQDSDAGSTPNPSFGIVGSQLSTTPLFDLSCSNITSPSSTASSSPSSTATASSSGSGSGSGSSGSVSSGVAVSSSAAGTTSAAGSGGSKPTSAPASTVVTYTSSVVSGGKTSESVYVSTVVVPASSGVAGGNNYTAVSTHPTSGSTSTGAGSSATPTLIPNSATPFQAGSLLGGIVAVFAAMMVL